MNGNLLRTLNEIEVDDLTLVGAKALHLALLNGNRLTTPPGLVVTSQFFKAQISHYAYQPIWAGSPDVAVTEGALHFLADFLKSNPLAPPLEAALQQRLCELFPPEVQFFAVRSSAIDEDRRDHSFAGCYLSELGVPRQMLTVSLTRCWASALTGRAIEYRLKRGLSIQAITTAVLIQPMLRPDAAGVAFTLNPVTGARDELVIEAAAGLATPMPAAG
ncbi:MAG: PEP/pyruvate-binding domain-containing protein [Anaerolineae bacterium]